jgi:hypothetical protein
LLNLQMVRVALTVAVLKAEQKLAKVWVGWLVSVVRQVLAIRAALAAMAAMVEPVWLWDLLLRMVAMAAMAAMVAIKDWRAITAVSAPPTVAPQVHSLGARLAMPARVTLDVVAEMVATVPTVPMQLVLKLKFLVACLASPVVSAATAATAETAVTVAMVPLALMPRLLPMDWLVVMAV